MHHQAKTNRDCPQRAPNMKPCFVFPSQEPLATDGVICRGTNIPKHRRLSRSHPYTSREEKRQRVRDKFVLLLRN